MIVWALLSLFNVLSMYYVLRNVEWKGKNPYVTGIALTIWFGISICPGAQIVAVILHIMAIIQDGKKF